MLDQKNGNTEVVLLSMSEEIPESNIVIHSKTLPKIFMIKIDNNKVIKVSYEKEYSQFTGYLNASFYISRSGMTFSGVLHYTGEGELKEIKGIYYFSSRKSIIFKSAKKITRNIDEMKNIIKEQIQKLNVKEAIIEFNNWKITIHTEYKIKKAPLIYFTNTINQGNLNIACLDKIGFSPWYESCKYPIGEEDKYFFWIYNHKISCNRPFVIAKPIFVSAGEFVLVFHQNKPEQDAEFTIESNEHNTLKFKVNTNKILVFYHYKPIKKID